MLPSMVKTLQVCLTPCQRLIKGTQYTLQSGWLQEECPDMKTRSKLTGAWCFSPAYQLQSGCSTHASMHEKQTLNNEAKQYHSCGRHQRHTNWHLMLVARKAPITLSDWLVLGRVFCHRNYAKLDWCLRQPTSLSALIKLSIPCQFGQTDINR